MCNNETETLSREVSRIYRNIDRKTGRLQRAASLECPTACGTCCETQKVEATVLETLPLADNILAYGEEESLLEAIEDQLSRDNYSCVLFRHDLGNPGNGYCSRYPFRPLLCRLFGFAARRNRIGELEFCACKHLTGISPEGVRRAQMGVSAGLRIPVYQESFMRIAAMNPAIGFQRRPINLAIKEAVEYLYWRRPKKVKLAKAS